MRRGRGEDPTGDAFASPSLCLTHHSVSRQFDISDLVRCMRLQRHGMVQTEVRRTSSETNSLKVALEFVFSFCLSF